MSEIDDLYADIERYESYIEELEEYYSKIQAERDTITSDYYTPAMEYDITVGSQFLGERKENAFTLQRSIQKKTESAQNETTAFLAAIKSAIENLKALIKDCNDKINALLAAMKGPDEEQGNA
ncbi:MAG: hypothetical protein IKZ97_01595 [Butyrivibrio sp.]|nr:hypothetical protein [Butyrivibrio sp.]